MALVGSTNLCKGLSADSTVDEFAETPAKAEGFGPPSVHGNKQSRRDDTGKDVTSGYLGLTSEGAFNKYDLQRMKEQSSGYPGKAQTVWNTASALVFGFMSCHWRT